MVKARASVDPNSPDNEPIHDTVADDQAIPTIIPSSMSQLDTSQDNHRFPLTAETHHVLEKVLKLAQDSEVHEAFLSFRNRPLE